MKNPCDSEKQWNPPIVAHIVEHLKPGDHVAFFYRSRVEQFEIAIPYITIGLQRNEQCVYIADDNSVPLIVQKLAAAGVDVKAAMKRDALRVLTKRETYLRHGIFEPAKMIADLRNNVDACLKAGFSAFRVTGEMTWALDLPSSVVRLLDYESALLTEIPQRLIGLCQYDETRFPESIIKEMIRIHPKVIARNQLIKDPLVSLR